MLEIYRIFIKLISKNSLHRLPIYFFFSFLLICCTDKKPDDDNNCNFNETALLSVKNTLPHGIWVDARRQVTQNNDKRFLLSGEMFDYSVHPGQVLVTTSFTSNDTDFKEYKRLTLQTCSEASCEINKVCSIHNTIERITFNNKTDKSIVVNIKHSDVYWVGENIIQPNESFSYYQVAPGYINLCYRYTDSQFWNSSRRSYSFKCNSITFDCRPYEKK
jgi:hypothetical protein